MPEDGRVPGLCTPIYWDIENYLDYGRDLMRALFADIFGWQSSPRMTPEVYESTYKNYDTNEESVISWCRDEVVGCVLNLLRKSYPTYWTKHVSKISSNTVAAKVFSPIVQAGDEATIRDTLSRIDTWDIEWEALPFVTHPFYLTVQDPELRKFTSLMMDHGIMFKYHSPLIYNEGYSYEQSIRTCYLNKLLDLLSSTTLISSLCRLVSSFLFVSDPFKHSSVEKYL